MWLAGRLPNIIATTALGKKISEHYWGADELKAGDKLMFKGRKLTIVRKNGTTELVNDFGEGVGSGSRGSAAGSVGDTGGVDTRPPSGGGGICITRGSVCTGGGCTYYSKVHPCSDRP